MIYNVDIAEALLLVERVHSNLSTANASDTLSFSETLSINRHVVEIEEVLLIRETLRRVGGIFNLTVSETLSLSERVVPRVFVADINEVLAIGERLNHHNIVDVLQLSEVLTYTLSSVVLDQLDLVETVGFTANRNLVVPENLVLTEGLSCVLITGRRPCVVGAQINTGTITLSSLDGRYAVQVKSPDFGNSEGLQYTRVNKKTRGGDLIVFRDPQWPKTIVFTYTWTNLHYTDRNRLLIFLKNTLGQVVNLLDYEGNTWSVFIRNPDTDFTRPQRSANEVKLEFEMQ